MQPLVPVLPDRTQSSGTTCGRHDRHTEAPSAASSAAPCGRRTFDGCVKADQRVYVYVTCKSLDRRQSLYNLKCHITTKEPDYSRENVVAVIVPREEIIEFEALNKDEVYVRMWDPSKSRVKVEMEGTPPAACVAPDRWRPLNLDRCIVMRTDSDCLCQEIAADVRLTDVHTNSEEDRVVVHITVRVRRHGAEHFTVEKELSCTISPFAINKREMYSNSDHDQATASGEHEIPEAKGQFRHRSNALSRPGQHEMSKSPGQFRHRSNALSRPGQHEMPYPGAEFPHGSNDFLQPDDRNQRSHTTSSDDSALGTSV